MEELWLATRPHKQLKARDSRWIEKYPGKQWYGLSFQQTYRLLIFEHCLGGKYLFIYSGSLGTFCQRGRGEEKEGFVPSIREI